MKIQVTTEFKVSGNSDLDHETDALFDALLIKEKSDALLSRTDVSAVLNQRLVTIALVVDAPTWDEAQSHASEVIREAIEMVGGRVLGDGGVASSNGHGLQASIQSTELIPA